jgi:hypothetical protein
MLVPNWKHHSKKEQKRKLKPQAMRARREALRHFKKRYMTLLNWKDFTTKTKTDI